MGQLGGEASIELPVAIEDVWAVVHDVEHAPSWQDALDEVRVLSRDAAGRVERAESVTDAKVKVIRSVVRFSYDEPRLVRWEQEQGDLKHVVGMWELAELGPAATRATYRLDGDPGRMLGMLIRGPVEGRLRDLLVHARPGELAARLGV